MDRYRPVTKKELKFLVQDKFINLGDIDTSLITDMSGMFKNAQSFNKSLNNWDVFNVEKMLGMFVGAKKFNQNLNDWSTKIFKSCNMYAVFEGSPLAGALPEWYHEIYI